MRAMATLGTIDSMAVTDYEPLVGTPWEKSGHSIPPGATVPEMLTAAGLDWSVLRGQNTLRVETENGTQLIPNPKSFGLVRSDNLAVLSAHVGPRYKEIQNDVAFEVFQEFVATGHMTLETAGSFGNGQHIWGLAKTGHGFQLANGDQIESYFLLIQSHRYGYALRAMWTPICYPTGTCLVQNITTKGLNGSSTFTMSHAREFNGARIREIKEVVGIASAAMDDFEGKATFMEKARVNTADAIRYLISVFHPELPGICETRGIPVPSSYDGIANSAGNRNLKKVAKMLEENRYADNSAWGCWNTVNSAYDHEMGHGEDSKLESIWLGKNKEVKVNAFKLASLLAMDKGRSV